MHLDLASALKKIVTRGGTALIGTCLPFGAKSAGHFWGVVSEVMADLMNEEFKDGMWPILSNTTGGEGRGNYRQ